GVRPRPWTYLTQPAREFRRRYAILGAWRDGALGLALSAWLAYYEAIAHVELARLWRRGRAAPPNPPDPGGEAGGGRPTAEATAGAQAAPRTPERWPSPPGSGQRGGTARDRAPRSSSPPGSGGPGGAAARPRQPAPLFLHPATLDLTVIVVSRN